MAFSFDEHVSLPENFHRIVLEEVKTSTKLLGKSNSERHSEAVHEARKSVKKLRALLRLVSPHLSGKTHAAEDKQLRDIGRSLSELRDAEALLLTFNQAAEQSELPGEEVAALRRHLDEQRESISNPEHVGQTLALASRELHHAAERMKVFEIPQGGPELLEKGLSDFYRRSRKAMGKARQRESAENIHSWRKRVKDHWYHARLLSSLDPNFWRGRVEQLKTLENLLGEAHNLSVLSGRLATTDRKQSRAFRRHLRSARLQLEAQAFELGEVLFNGKRLHWHYQPRPVAA